MPVVPKLLQGVAVGVAITAVATAQQSSHAAPPALPQCNSLGTPSIGSQCYESTPVGVRVRPGDNSADYKNIFQSTQPEYVLVDVLIDNIEVNGSYGAPTKSMLSPGGQSMIVRTSTDRLNQIKQLRAELEGKASVLAGPALIEARNKIDALIREERTYETVVQSITSAGQDAGKYEVSGWAKPHKCGWMNLDTCGSWSRATVYVVKRYVGNDTEAYNRANSAAIDARSTIDRLIATPPPGPGPGPGVQCPAGTQWNGSACQPAPVVQCPAGTQWNGSACQPAPVVQCPAGTQWNGSACQPVPIMQCPAGTQWNGSACQPISTVQCPAGTQWNGQGCVPSPPTSGCLPGESPLACFLRTVMAK